MTEHKAIGGIGECKACGALYSHPRGVWINVKTQERVSDDCDEARRQMYPKEPESPLDGLHIPHGVPLPGNTCMGCGAVRDDRGRFFDKQGGQVSPNCRKAKQQMIDREEDSASRIIASPPDLTPAQLERLAFLAEECAETTQMAMKIVRHGYESVGWNNRRQLTKEAADAVYAIQLMIEKGDIDEKLLRDFIQEKKESVKKYLHHQKP